MAKPLTDYVLYRWRYILGYGAIIVTILGLLIIAGFLIPGGLSQDEMQTVATSNATSISPAAFQPAEVINMPYHILQHASITLLGVSVFSIKLPSLLLGLFSAVGMFLLLRTWFRENVAVLTAIITIATGQFLSVAQSGTPSIMYVFLPVWLLTLAMFISRHTGWQTLWKVGLFGIAALSMYTPLSPYILAALLSAILLHPHLRYIVRQLPKVKVALGVLFGLILLIPLGYAIFKQPSVVLTLLGIPTEHISLKANLLQLLHQYFDFIAPSSGVFMTPVYGLGSLVLIVLGFIQLVTTKYTARSYIVTAWVILLIPLLIVNPGYVSITFVPVMLLMAMGIHRLLSSWYSLFPRNPYARLAGLLPLIVLISGLVISGINRYMYGYTYDPQTASNFSHDLRLLNSQLAVKDRGTTVIVSAPPEAPFYTVVQQHTTRLAVSSSLPAALASAHTVIVTHAAHQTDTSPQLVRIITDGTSRDADRFYIYKTLNK